MTRMIRIFDTTLRDGEQCPGASMNVEQKLAVARQLARLNVDVIEAGFAISSPGDFEAVQRISREIRGGPIVCSLARAVDKDVDRAWEALREAGRPRIHTFISTSDIHLKYQFRMTREQAMDRAVEMVKRARNYVEDVEFSPMDASRSDPEYLFRVIEAVIDAGAGTVNIPDTVGYAVPDEFGALIRGIVEKVPNAHKVVISVHCHNDLGLASANTLAAIQAGARQVEVTINGLGERAGNASLEEVVMALRTRPTQFPQLGSHVQTEQITAASRLVSYLTGFAVQPNKAVVGANAFAHESGIHQDGVIKNPLTYEIMTPQSIGLSGSQLTIGKLSGRRGLQQKLRQLGHEVEGEALDELYRAAVALADAKKEVTDADLHALVEQRVAEVPQAVRLEGWNVTSSHGGKATGMVSLAVGDEERATAAIGNGPVDALFAAVDQAVEPAFGWHPVLESYEIKAVSGGEDAQGRVLVRCRRSSDVGPGALVVSGHGLSTNIIEASLDAYLTAVNKLRGAEIGPASPAFVAQRTAEHLP